MVRVTVTCLDHGDIASISHSTFRLSDALAQDVIFADTMAHGTLLGVAIAGMLQLPFG